MLFVQPAKDGVDCPGVVHRIGSSVAVGLIAPCLAYLAAAAQQVHAFVVRNAKQPCPVTRRVFETCHIADDRDPGFLDGVTCKLRVPGDNASELHERRLPSGDQQSNGVAVTGLAAQDQPLVINVIGFCVHCMQ